MIDTKKNNIMSYPMWFRWNNEKDNTITIDIANDKPVSAGYEMMVQHPNVGKIRVVSVKESRLPGKYGKNNHPDGIMWHQVSAVRV